MKTEFESRISFHSVRMRCGRKGRGCEKRVYEASVYWGGQLYETMKATKELCVEDLKLKTNQL